MPIWVDVLGVLTKIVLVGLVFLSVWSISIILDRRRYLKNLQDSVKGLRPQLSNLLQEKKTKSQDVLQLLAKSFVAQEKLKMEKGLGVLATLGSNAPFIGLFGTVLGIIQSFGMLSLSEGNINGVMFSIAEALVATAVGLLVAIPAVVAFNAFSRTIRIIVTECTIATDQFISESLEVRK